ncbi:MAG: ECF transporter S component [Oscillospiraceae bacterium]|jgi:riboflavin transporter FmnP|nr:ECF transporter S component [Oscillospiraceae bacterium]
MGEKLRRLARASILTGIAVVLMYLEFPLPFFPAFLEYDFSEVPALIGAFAMGPAAGVSIVAAKALLHLPVTTTLGVGELANLIVGITFVFTAGTIYELKKTRAGALTAMLCGTAAMAAAGAAANYFIILPFYLEVMGFSLETILSMASQFFLPPTGMATLILYVFVTFNLLKALAASAITFLIYKRISRLFKPGA